MHIEQVEFNTLITFLGMLCATVQLSTGYYAGHYKRRLAVLITNEVPFRSHRAFDSFFTVLYILGLFAGVAGFIGALT